MKTPDQTITADTELVVGASVTVKTVDSLERAVPWMKFIGIVGYIGIGVMVVLGLSLLAVTGFLADTRFEVVFPVLGAFYIAFSLLLFFPVRFLMRMAKAANHYKQGARSLDLEAIVVNLGQLAQYDGVVLIVILAIKILAFVGVVVFASSFFSNLF